MKITRSTWLCGPLLAASLAACTVGPDYMGPPNVAPMAAVAASFHRASVAPVTNAPPPSRWWEALNDPLLTHLIDDAMASSPTLKQAQARLRNARATLNERRAGLLPQGGATGLYARTQIPLGDATSLLGGSSTDSGSASTASSASSETASAIPSDLRSDLYDAGFDASWEIDIFGGTRRGIEGAHAQAESQRAALADSQVQLASEVARAYVNLRDVQHRVELSRRSGELEARMLALTRQRRALGTASQGDVERLATQLNQTQADLVPLQAQVEQYEDQLAMLTAAEPGQLDAELNQPGALPLPPASVPIGDPAAMLRRRPDIREAERSIAANNAMIGQAVAQLFPQVSLLGTVGFSSTEFTRLFDGDSLTYLGAPTISWSILNFPRTRARIQEAKAGRDAALAQYQNSVLSALQDANTSLSRFGRQRQNVDKLVAADASASRAAALTRQRYAGGTASLIDALDAERQRLQTEQSLAQAKAMLTNDYVSLQAALGLGWTA